MALTAGTHLGHHHVTSRGEGSSGLPTPAQPRTRPIRLRLTALLVLGVFATVSIATTVFSLGAYCLTTYSGNPFAGSLP